MEDPMADAPTPHPEIVALQYPLSRLTEALKRQRKIKIVAIGSSSTAGEGDVIPFPHRLELLLRAQYPGRMIDVVNRGIGGQEAPEEFARFEGDVGAEAPVLVIWQMGTNAIYHRSDYNLRCCKHRGRRCLAQGSFGRRDPDGHAICAGAVLEQRPGSQAGPGEDKGHL
jgi:hypothetical protein